MTQTLTCNSGFFKLASSCLVGRKVVWLQEVELGVWRGGGRLNKARGRKHKVVAARIWGAVIIGQMHDDFFPLWMRKERRRSTKEGERLLR